MANKWMVLLHFLQKLHWIQVFLKSASIHVTTNCLDISDQRRIGIFLIISPTKKLIAVIEFKSQVGSFGNNFNNRTEEALGSAVDLWTAFRENVFPNQNAPWVGYLMTVERCAKSMSVVRVAEPHFGVLDEFKNTSYLDRYSILCRKLILERYYTSTALLWTSDSDAYGDVAEDISINTFLSAFSGYLQGVANEFE